MAIIGRISWLKKKIVDNVLDMLVGLLGGAVFWLSMIWIFYFDNWTARLLSIFATVVCIYLIAKFFDRFYPR